MYEANCLIVETILEAFCKEFPWCRLNNQMCITAKYNDIRFFGIYFKLPFLSML